MSDVGKLYIDAPNGVMGQDVLRTVMAGLLKHTDDVQLDSDEHGTFFVLSAEALSKYLDDRGFPEDEGKTEPAKRKPGRPRKNETRE